MDEKSLSTGLAELAAMSAPGAMHHGQAHEHHGPSASTRETTYQGHAVVIRTTYEVSIDGTPIQVPFHVDENGNVSCHAVPNYQASSALDVARRIIDAYPHHFPPGGKSKRKRGGAR